MEIGLPFKPQAVGEAYLAWPLLPDLFPSFFAGVQTKRDELVIDVERDPLVERMKQYFDPKISHDEMRRICARSMQPTARFEAKSARDYLLKRGFLAQNVVRHCYRPFDLRWIYYEPETRLLGEKSPDYFPQVFDGNVWIVSQQKPRREWSRPQFIRSIGCLDLMDRSASCIPLYLSPSKEAKPLLTTEAATDPRQLPDGRRLNVSNSLATYLRGVTTIADAPSVFYHALAILHSLSYRTENAGALRQDWPRVPLPDSKKTLLVSAQLGQQVAALLDTESHVHGVTSGEIRAELRILSLPTKQGGGALKEDDLVLTVGWGHVGKGGVVMPGKGKVVERDYAATERAAIADGAKGLGLPAELAFAHLGEKTCDVYLNETAYWANVPAKVWEYTIGGYQVIKKWLSYREKKILGRVLSKEEVREVRDMARRIAAILLLEPTLDANYQAVKNHAFPWPPTAESGPQ